MDDTRSPFAAKTLGLMGGVVTSMVMSACYGAPPGTDLQPPTDTGDWETGHTGDTGLTGDTADSTGDTGDVEDTGDAEDTGSGS